MIRGRAARFWGWAILVILHIVAPNVALAVPAEAVKTKAIAGVDRRAADMTGLANQIWEFAETALQLPLPVVVSVSVTIPFAISAGVGV